MAIAICNMMIELVRAQVALESGSFEVPSPSGPGRGLPIALHHELAAIGVVPPVGRFSPSDCTVPTAACRESCRLAPGTESPMTPVPGQRTRALHNAMRKRPKGVVLGLYRPSIYLFQIVLANAGRDRVTATPGSDRNLHTQSSPQPGAQPNFRQGGLIGRGLLARLHGR